MLKPKSFPVGIDPFLQNSARMQRTLSRPIRLTFMAGADSKEVQLLQTSDQGCFQFGCNIEPPPSSLRPQELARPPPTNTKSQIAITAFLWLASL
jgi:hypothetical protein